MLNILLQTLPGAAITYQGEELVMTNVHLTWEETVDPQACNSNPEIYESRSRDPARTPFPVSCLITSLTSLMFILFSSQWDSTKNAGFSSGNSTWLPVGNNYRLVNVKAQQDAVNSHLKIFKQLTTIRKREVFRKGDYTSALSNNKHVYTYKRQYGNEVAIVVLNFGLTQEVVDLASIFEEIPTQIEIQVSSLDSGLVSG
jgi:alpha-glucosidase